MYISNMTVLKVIVEDNEAASLKKLLSDIPAVKSVEEDIKTTIESPYERIKNILDSAKGKNLFADIDDPSEWQRQIRKEWDRDF